MVGQRGLFVMERQGVEGAREHVQRPRLPILREIIRPQLRCPLQGLDEARIEALVVYPASAHHAGQTITGIV
jgi:hypothetical protein